MNFRSELYSFQTGLGLMYWICSYSELASGHAQNRS